MNSWPKICLKCDSKAQVEELESKAKENGVASFVNQDQSVCVIGPALASKVNQVTGHLKLLWKESEVFDLF